MIIDPAKLSNGWQIVETTVALSFGQSKQLVGPNIRRVAISILSASTNITVYPFDSVGASKGYQVTTAVAFDRVYSLHGGIVSSGWWGYPVGGMGNVYIVETIWLPDRVPGLARLLGK